MRHNLLFNVKHSSSFHHFFAVMIISWQRKWFLLLYLRKYLLFSLVWPCWTTPSSDVLSSISSRTHYDDCDALTHTHINPNSIYIYMYGGKGRAMLHIGSATLPSRDVPYSLFALFYFWHTSWWCHKVNCLRLCMRVCMWKAFSAIIRKVGSNRPRLHLQLRSQCRTRYTRYPWHEDCSQSCML